MERLYLDSSAIVKRYIEERGSLLLADLYEAAEREAVLLQFSLWNIGEVFGVFDAYRRRGWISTAEEARAASSFAAETVKLIRLGTLAVLPVNHGYLVRTWKLIRRRHVYQADALQALTALANHASALITADSQLQSMAQKEGMQALHVELHDHEIRSTIG